MTEISNKDVDIYIRETVASDFEWLAKLYPSAFPDEDLLPLVRELLGRHDDLLSLVALFGDHPIGHVAFSACGVADSEDKISLLAPLAVAPTHHRRGVGSALVREGLGVLRTRGARRVQVLGDPVYYRRFGFRRDDNIHPPYPLPPEWREAWQYMDLDDSYKPPAGGSLCVPDVWQREELWLP